MCQRWVKIVLQNPEQLIRLDLDGRVDWPVWALRNWISDHGCLDFRLDAFWEAIGSGSAFVDWNSKYSHLFLQSNRIS